MPDTTASDPLKTYWAALPKPDIGGQLVARLDNYGTATLTTAVSVRQARAYQYYFGLDPSGVHATSQILRAGPQGEFAAIKVNHSRSLVNTLLNLIVAPKIVWQPKAVNIDYDSLRETELAAAVLEYYWQELATSAFATRALEEALVFGEDFGVIGLMPLVTPPFVSSQFVLGFTAESAFGDLAYQSLPVNSAKS